MKNSRLATLFLTLGMLVFFVSGTAFAASVDDVKKSGELRIGIADFEFEPFYFSRESGSPRVGFDYDLGEAIAARMGVKAKFVMLPWQGGIDLAWNDSAKGWAQYDLICSSVTITDTRAQAVDFSDWYVTTGQMVAVKSDAGLDSFDAIRTKGGKIGVLAGSTGEAAAKSAFPSMEIVGLKSVEEIFDALRKDNVICVVYDGPAMIVEAKKDSTIIALDTETLSKEKYGCVMEKGSDMKAVVDQVVVEMRKDLYKRWLK